MPLTRKALHSCATSFCAAFANNTPADQIMTTHFSKRHQISVLEHGETSLGLPFLGKPFKGSKGVTEYFTIISSLLSYKEMTFSEFVVDVEAMKVACKGQAKFTWLETAQEWNESFAYILDFDDGGKVTDYQIWADTGAAYFASKGMLTKAEKENTAAKKG